MTKEKKAKAYDEALERAKNFIENGDEGEKTVAESIFAGLIDSESDDEKIRKELIEFIQWSEGRNFIRHDFHQAKRPSEWLAWLEKQGKMNWGLNEEKMLDEIFVAIHLDSAFSETHRNRLISFLKTYRPYYQSENIEKQGEQKKQRCGVSCFTDIVQAIETVYNEESAYELVEYLKWLVRRNEQKTIDKVEPKFKVGDWITDNTSTFQIVRIEIERAENGVEYKWYYADDGDRICFDVAHQYYHLWTIQDAKDGDVLAVEAIKENYQYPFVAIYKERGLDFFNSYCFNGIDGKFYKDDAGHTTEKIHPATKEQCDLLFQKMKEAGYKWDDDKKELKKISQRMVAAEVKEALYDRPAEKSLCFNVS